MTKAVRMAERIEASTLHSSRAGRVLTADALSGRGGEAVEDYMLEGPLAALQAIEHATGEREVNAVGYCLGGILLSALSAWLRAKGDTRLASTPDVMPLEEVKDELATLTGGQSAHRNAIA